MKHILSLLFALIIFHTTFSQITKLSNATITNVNFSLTSDNKVVITYNIAGGKPSEKFDVVFFVYTASGSKLDAKTASGDIKGVYAGLGKRIIWDIGKDIAYLNENISIELEATQINPKVVPYTSKGTAIVWSTFFPGAGSTRLGQNGAHIFKGLIAYTFIGLSVKYNKAAVNTYNDYKSETSGSIRNSLFNQSQSELKKSKYLFSGAIVIWAIDYLNIAYMKNKTDKRKKNISFSPIITPVNGQPTFGLAFSFK